MTTITLSNILDQLVDEVRGGAMAEDGLGIRLGGTTTVNAASTFTTTSQELYRLSTNAPSTRLQGWYSFVGDDAAADQIRMIESHSVAAAAAANVTTVTHAGPNTSAGTSTAHWLLRIHPGHLIALINDALELELADITLPVVQGTDWDMQTSGVTNWTDTNATSSKVTTAANVLYGVRGLRVALSGADGYSASPLVRIPRGQQVRVWAIGRADVGSAVATVVDGSGTTLTTMSHTEENWTYMWEDLSPGSTAEEIGFRLGGDGASDDTYWAAIGVEVQDQQVFQLPAWADERFKVKSLALARFLGATDSGQNRQALSRELYSIMEGSDWRYISEHPSVNGYWVEIERRWLDYNSPYFISGKPPYSYFGTFTVPDEDTAAAVTETSTIPLHIVISRCKWLLAERYGALFPFIDKGSLAREIHIRRLERYTRPPEQLVRSRGMFRR